MNKKTDALMKTLLKEKVAVIHNKEGAGPVTVAVDATQRVPGGGGGEELSKIAPGTKKDDHA